jgi:hypothetical protein
VKTTLSYLITSDVVLGYVVSSFTGIPVQVTIPIFTVFKFGYLYAGNYLYSQANNQIAELGALIREQTDCWPKVKKT